MAAAAATLVSAAAAAAGRRSPLTYICSAYHNVIRSSSSMSYAMFHEKSILWYQLETLMKLAMDVLLMFGSNCWTPTKNIGTNETHMYTEVRHIHEFNGWISNLKTFWTWHRDQHYDGYGHIIHHDLFRKYPCSCLQQTIMLLINTASNELLSASFEVPFLTNVILKTRRGVIWLFCLFIAPILIETDKASERSVNIGGRRDWALVKLMRHHWHNDVARHQSLSLVTVTPERQ